MGSSHHIEAQGPSKAQRPRLWFSVLLFFSILLSLTFFLPSTIAPYLMVAEGPPVYQCGNSPEEACSNKCLFDVISFSWLPPDCFDGDLVNDFFATSEWQWYKDAETSTPPSTALFYKT